MTVDNRCVCADMHLCGCVGEWKHGCVCEKAAECMSLQLMQDNVSLMRLELLDHSNRTVEVFHAHVLF